MDTGTTVGPLPFFPLPGAVLFPGSHLPLHIFEPRYRQMVTDCLEGNGAMVIALLAPGAGPAPARAPVHPVAGMGVIVAHEKLPDGRFNILLQGLARVRLEEVPSDRLYRLARAQILTDVVKSPPPSTTALMSLAVQIAARMRRIEPRFELNLPQPLEASGLCDQLADRLIRHPGSRQRVLEELDVEARVDLVTTILGERFQELVGVEGRDTQS
jgi:uncharacterized protein